MTAFGIIMFVANVICCVIGIVYGNAFQAVVNAVVACALGHQLLTWREFRR